MDDASDTDNSNGRRGGGDASPPPHRRNDGRGGRGAKQRGGRPDYEVVDPALIAKPVAGVVEVNANPATKTVCVDRGVDVVSAKYVCAETTAEMIPKNVFVKSTFVLLEDANASTEEVIQTLLEDKYTKEQMRHVTLEGHTLSVEHNPYNLTAAGVVAALKDLMFDVSVDSDGGADGLWGLSLLEDVADEVPHKPAVEITVRLSGAFWLISMLSYLGPQFEPFAAAGLVSVVCGLPPIARKAYRTMGRCQFDVNCMMLFAAVGAVALREFTEAAAVTFLFSVSEPLEARAAAKANNALSAIVRLRPEQARVVNPRTGEAVVLPATAVAVGTLVSVQQGDKVPCDGVVVEGRSTIDESR